jgi:sugar phosphate isomerase/epimerase
MIGSTTTPREAFDRLSSAGFRSVQLSATHPGMRPRDLDASARRELLSVMRRSELTASGLDLWIPVAHFADLAQVDRAMTATQSAIVLAADLGRQPVSLILPHDQELTAAILTHALHHGVELVDHAVPLQFRESLSAGIDPAAWLADGTSPIEAVRRSAKSLRVARLCDLSRDGVRRPVGGIGGRLDVREYRLTLDLVSYSHTVIIDARQWVDPWAGIQQSRDCWDANDPLSASL